MKHFIVFVIYLFVTWIMFPGPFNAGTIASAFILSAPGYFGMWMVRYERRGHE